MIRFTTCALLLLWFPQASRAGNQQSEAYLRTLDNYCAGGTSPAADMIRWRSAQINEALRTAEGLSPERRIVAALLHAEVYSELWKYERGSVPPDHRDASQALAASARRPGTNQLVRQWSLMWGYFLLGHLFLDDANRHFAQARAWFPDDADLITASGIVHELAGHPLGQQTIRAHTSTTSVQRQKAMAQAFYESAIQKAPRHPEATLRLGRLEFLNGDLRNSVAMLSRVRELTTDRSLLYLMHLFLGQANAARGDAAKAVEEYDRAAALVPGAPTAAIALDATRTLLGGPVIDERSKWWIGAPGVTSEDPWNEYLFSQPYRFLRTAAALKSQACNPN